MKFEYSNDSARDNCVAYIKGNMLVINGDNGEAVMVGYAGVYIGAASFQNYMEGATKKFYRGDEVTITF